MFKVEYVGEPENPQFSNGSDQFMCDIDPQVVNPLDPNMNCVACYSPVPYAINNNTGNSSRSNSPPFHSSIVTDTSATITDVSASLPVSAADVTNISNDCPGKLL